MDIIDKKKFYSRYLQLLVQCKMVLELIEDYFKGCIACLDTQILEKSLEDIEIIGV